jgi:hypothetical protein
VFGLRFRKRCCRCFMHPPTPGFAACRPPLWFILYIAIPSANARSPMKSSQLPDIWKITLYLAVWIVRWTSLELLTDILLRLIIVLPKSRNSLPALLFRWTRQLHASLCIVKRLGLSPAQKWTPDILQIWNGVEILGKVWLGAAHVFRGAYLDCTSQIKLQRLSSSAVP